LVFLPRGVSTTFLIQTPHVDTEVALGSPDYSLSVSQNSEEPGRGWRVESYLEGFVLGSLIKEGRV
jgi:hypothetical protein